MTRAARLVRERLEEQNPEAVLLDGLEDGLVGTWENEHNNLVAVYDWEKCVECHCKRGPLTMSYEDAVEWHSYNTMRALPYVPIEHRPIMIALAAS